MKQQTRHAIIGVLCSVLLFFALTEIGLRTLDPLGVETVARGHRLMFYNATPMAHGFTIAPGVYDARRWQFTINPDGTRHVPDTQPADCTLVFIGDSLAWGAGVNDSDTFANVIARQLRDVHVLNAARPAYNIRYIADLPNRYPADAYVYLAYDNDSGQELPDTAFTPSEQWRFAIKRNLEAITRTYNAAWWGRNLPYYSQMGFAVWGRDDVLVFAFENTSLRDALPDSAVYIPPYAVPVSIADYHPNAASHQQIAYDMMPHINRLISETCNAE